MTPKAKPVKMARRHGNPVSAGAKTWAKAQRVVPSGYREVFVHGVPWDPSHLVEMHGTVTAQRTLCDNRPGKTPDPTVEHRHCPVCWKAR